MSDNIDEFNGNPFPEKIKEKDLVQLDFFELISNQRSTLLTFLLLGIIAGLCLAFLLPKYYTVSSTVVAVSENGNEGNNQVSNVAKLVGFDAGTAVNERELGLLYLQSREFLLNFISNHNLTEILFADEKLNEDEALQPSQIYEKFEEFFSVTELRDSSAITISISWKDAELAKNWLNWILEDINNLMRERARINGENSLNYLNNQLSVTNDLDVKRSFVGMIKEETQKLMLTNIREEYLFEIIDEPLIPEHPTKPNRKLVFVLSILLAAISGIITSLYRERKKIINTNNKK